MKMFLLTTMMVITMIEIAAEAETHTYRERVLEIWENGYVRKVTMRWQGRSVTLYTFPIISRRYLPIFSFKRKHLYMFDPLKRQHLFSEKRKTKQGKWRMAIFLHHLCVVFRRILVFQVFWPQFKFFESVFFSFLTTMSQRHRTFPVNLTESFLAKSYSFFRRLKNLFDKYSMIYSQ